MPLVSFPENRMQGKDLLCRIEFSDVYKMKGKGT